MLAHGAGIVFVFKLAFIKNLKQYNMKKFFVTGFLLAMLGIVSPAFAQEDTAKKSVPGKVKHGVKKGWKGTKKTAKKVGNETAETATKAKSKVTDNKSSEWVAPNGQDIYIDDGNKYYWINESGKRVFVSKDQLRPKQ